VDTEVTAQLVRLANDVNKAFWEKWEFWIGTLLNVGGLILSGLAFWQASKAREAAVEAGRTVKAQTVAIELSEVAQRLDLIQPEITYREARDILSEISRRVRRVISPFDDDQHLGGAVALLRGALSSAQDSLKTVRPADPLSETKAPDAVYFGVENEFSAINNAIADFLGLLEKKTIERGNVDGH
jgi:hypothetical protein